jgi:hypothetical protein
VLWKRNVTYRGYHNPIPRVEMRRYMLTRCIPQFAVCKGTIAKTEPATPLMVHLAQQLLDILYPLHPLLLITHHAQ